jgi:hypothetical protein
VIDLLAQTEEELLFFCIHDADISGTLIYQALQGATKARPERKVRIINLGLEAWEGLGMQLEVETLEKRSTKNPAQYVLEYDADWKNEKPAKFSKYDRWADWADWMKSFRIELNAMDTPTFVQWLDAKITAYDSVGKVIPHEDFLQAEAQETVRAVLKERIKAEILQKLDIEKMVEQNVLQKFPELQAKIEQMSLEENVRKDLSNHLQQSWRRSFLDLLNELL